VINMRDRDGDLVQLFVRDLDSLELPERGRWRPAPRKESVLMKATRLVLTAGAIVALVVVALAWTFSQRSSPVAATQSPSVTPTASAAATQSPSATPTASAAVSSAPTQPSAAATGAITGQLGYPSDFVPPLTVYAISVNDSKVWFSTDTPRFGNPVSATPAPGGPTWPPSGPGTYTLTGIAPGTYYVMAWRNDDVNVEALRWADVYSRYTVNCIQPSQAGPSATPPPACSGNDHTLVPVTVRAGETLSRIDLKDWYNGPGSESYPPRPR
jgi:hypothetical protein